MTCFSQIKLRFWVAVAVAAVMLLGASQARAGEMSLMEAAAKAKKTGLPLFVTFGGPNCPYCVAMKKRLSTEADLVDLISKQYVYLETDASNAESKQFIEHYKIKVEGIPHTVIISAKGDLVKEQVGAPPGDELKKLLMEGIEKTGGMKSLASAQPKKTGKVTKLEKDELAAVLKEVSDAKDQLAGEETSLSAMVELLSLNRRYIKINDVKKEIAPIFADINKDKAQSAIFSQARMLDSAAVAVENKKTKLAETTYNTVIKKYADSPAAKYATEALEKMKQPEAETAAKPAEAAPAKAKPTDSASK